MPSAQDRKTGRDHLRKAQLLIDVGRFSEAMGELSSALASNPDYYEALCSMALCHYSLKQYQEAYDWTKRAIESSPEDEWAYRLQSNIFRDNGEGTRAIAAATTAVEKAPYSPATVQTLFWAYASSGYLDDAEEPLEELGRMIPGSESFHEASGYLAMKRKNFDEAERWYMDALKINPESVQALNNLGVIYLELAQSGKGRHYKKKAQDMFHRAVKTEPTFKTAQDNIRVASSAARVGVPIGLIMMAWVGLRILGGAAAELGSGRISLLDVLANVNPIVPSILLSLANFYFLIVIAACIGIGISLIKKTYREAVAYEFSVYRGWLVLCLAFLAAGTLFIAAFQLSNTGVEETPPLSAAGAIISIVVAVFAGMNLLSHWHRKRNTV